MPSNFKLTRLQNTNAHNPIRLEAIHSDGAFFSLFLFFVLLKVSCFFIDFLFALTCKVIAKYFFVNLLSEMHLKNFKTGKMSFTKRKKMSMIQRNKNVDADACVGKLVSRFLCL